MDTIRPYIWIAAGVASAVCLMWLLLGGIFSTVSSIVPYAWVLILVALIVGVVAWVLRYPVTEINALGENRIVWGLFQTVLVIGFVVLFVQAVLWIRDGTLFSWIGIDVSPQTRMFTSLIAVALILFSFSPMFNWVIPTEGVFSKAVFRAVVASAGLLLFASIHSPKAYFNPLTGNPVVKLDSEGNEYRDPLKIWSPSTGEKLEYITPEQAKKIKPWWERWWATIEKWNSERATATTAPKAETSKPGGGWFSSSIDPDCTVVQRAEGTLSGNAEMKAKFVASRCKEVYFEQHDNDGVVQFNNPCPGWKVFFQAVKGSPQLWGRRINRGPFISGGIADIPNEGMEVTDWRDEVNLKKFALSPFTAVTKVACLPS